jgi:hypothetical protein
MSSTATGSEAAELRPAVVFVRDGDAGLMVRCEACDVLLRCDL